MRICLATAELAPLAKTGGLGDVCAALARWLHEAGDDVRVFLPLYSRIDAAKLGAHPVEFLQGISIDMGGVSLRFDVATARLPGTSLWIYLVHCPALYGGPEIYGSGAEEAVRFAVLTRAALESCQRMGWPPQIFHANDWHTALAPVYLRTVYGWDGLFARTRTLLTLHNVAYQGIFGAELLGRLGLGGEADRFDGGDLAEGRINFLKTGVVHADGLSTVSPTHAQEIRTPEYGRGLDPWLRARSERLVGILNGVDYGVWSPEVDELIPFRYSADDLTGKERNKRALLEELGLPYDPQAPVVGIVSRLVPQKGFDLLFGPLPELVAARDMRVVVLGSGASRYEGFFTALQQRFRDKVCFYNGFSEKLAHWIEAGSDIFLMPSAYEPCGLNQMYSLRYGTVPVVRKTGGLADSVEPYDPSTGAGTGFLFEHYDPSGARWALEAALGLFPDRAAWRRLMRNGMSRDFSWQKQIRIYRELYRRLAAGA
ncbi:MAG: glycogen synthase [Thermoanaerobaculia bacterium]|nr:glycogen synthase [Thermoanaerobaculia bacterium]